MSKPWDRAKVKARLVAASELVEATTRRPGPRAYGQALPDPLQSKLDVWFQQQSADYDRQASMRNRVRISASAEEIKDADEALKWPAQFVRDERRRQALALYLRATVRGIRWSAAVIGANLAHRSASRWRDEALDEIADELNREGRQQRQRNPTMFADVRR